ncbi:MAG: hypothetical protein KF760_31460 [Candidatus Eremiobacteraeota bacterium]|nr:hypothetical protein [Candidatus Eremiobacteraeota bacterium]MCW5871825.1 hypothetical protein [Candidatus Eremiobacteraeota bacterium]
MGLASYLFAVTYLFWVLHAYRWAGRVGLVGLYRLEQLVRLARHQELERAAQAIQGHPQAIAFSRAAALRCRAYARLCLGKLKEAEDDVYLSLEWNAREGRSYLLLAMVCWEREPQRALEALTRAWQLRKFWGWKPVARAIVMYRGLALTCLNRGPEALECFQKSALPALPHCQRYRARALALCGRFQEGLEILRNLSEPDEYLTLAAFLQGAERYEDSLFWANRSLQENFSLEALALKGHALFSLGREPEAEHCLQRWLEIETRPADFALTPSLTHFGRENGSIMFRLTSRPSDWN